jgi:hypothetical protein
MEPPETRYTTSGDVNIAHQVVGEGPFDVVFVPSLTHHIKLVWENPPQAGFFERLASRPTRSGQHELKGAPGDWRLFSVRAA